MLNTDELLQNLPHAIRILQFQITRNIFGGEQNFSVFYLGNEITQLIYETDFKLKVSDVLLLSSYQELLQITPPRSREYLYSRIEEFFHIWINPIRSEHNWS